MADRTNADSHHSLSLDSLHQVSKDMQGPDKSIPLSPQWLLPKPGDAKHGMVSAGESNQHPYPGSASRSGISKPASNTEDLHDNEKKRDVFRPSVHDLDSVRRDRWRDEERDTNSAIRRDRRKDGEKDIGDTRKVDRWVDTPIKQSGDPRRAPSDRWNDLNTKDGNVDQRRDTKWSTRWGPDDKEAESWREKSQETARDSELFRNKVPSHATNQGKEDKEVDHYRPWRPNSSQSRGSGEPPHQTLTPNRPTSTFGYGRGRGENLSPNFTVGRGRVGTIGSVLNNTSTQPHSGAVLGKGEGSHSDQSSFRYNRIKLLDIYRTTDVISHQNPLDAFYEIPPSLTQAEPLDPLALSAPTPEELAILKGIDKGDIVNSGLPQSSKEGPVGRSNQNSTQVGRTKIAGSRDDLPSVNDGYKEESADTSFSSHPNYSETSEKYVHPHGSEAKSEAFNNLQKHRDSKFGVEAWSDPQSHSRVKEVPFNREVNVQGGLAHQGAPWRSDSLGERPHTTSHDWGNLPVQNRPRNSDAGWSHLQKERDTVLENSAVAQSYYKDQPSWQAREGLHSDYGRDSTIKRQLSDSLDREQEARKYLQQTSPEDLSLYYKDPQGEIQGPFPGGDLIGWFEAGYFGIDLQVRVANALPGTPFASLGDVMPHLRAKAKAPPGFGAPKQTDVSEAINKLNFSTLGNIHANTSEIDILKTDPRNRNESMNEAENKFLESLMSGSLSSSPLEKFASSGGLHGYMGSNAVGKPPMGLETGNDLSYLLAQRMSMERHRPPQNPHSNWPGRDASSVLPKSEFASESALPAQVIPSMVDSSHRVPHSQNVDLISLLQSAANKPAPPANSGASSWSNFPVQGGLDVRQEKLEMHHNQLFSQAAYGVQQQRLQPQNQQSLTNIIGPSVDSTSGIVTPEKLLSSGLSQDPQMLSLLQQQYLLSQLQLQSQTPVNPQLSLLDKLLLLKQQQQQQQQQQQEQQQKQLLLQQHLLSQVLSEQQSHQHLGESRGHLQGVTDSVGNGPVDRLGLRSPYESYQSNSQSSQHNYQGGHPSGIFQSQISQEAGQHSSSETPIRSLPHQMFDSNYQKVKDISLIEQLNENQRKDSLLVSTTNVSTLLSEAIENSLPIDSVLLNNRNFQESYAVAEEQTLENARADNSSERMHGIPESIPTSRINVSGVSLPEEFSNTQNLTSSASEEMQVQKEEHQRESALLNENKGNEALEVKKVSEKKSRKQKSSKANSSSDKAKGASQVKQSESEGKPSKDTKIKASTGAVDLPQTVASQLVQSSLPGSKPSNIHDSIEIKVQDQPKEVDLMSPRNEQTQSGHRAWKPAPGFKAKSLLEIQQEEQRVAHQQIANSDSATAVNLVSSPLPWTGIVAGMDPKISKDYPEAKSDGTSNQKSKKSQLHDLLAEEVLAKSDEKVLQDPDNASGLPSETVMPMQTGSAVDDEEFIQAKDSRKNRKKSGKVKGTGVKVATSVSSADILVASSPIEKVKGYRQVQQETEVLPAPPSGPSLGDFVLWKGEPTNSSPVPAWMTDSGKLSKPTSLRDIQKEQGKKNVSVPHQAPTPAKSQPTRGNRGAGPSLTPSGSSLSVSASSVHVNSVVPAQSKSKADDDLFWGPIEPTKQEAKQSDFPSLANPGGYGYKSPSTKGTAGGSSKKLTGGKPAEYSHSSPATAHSSVKEKRDAVTKHTEAMDFRDWCESETVRLTGSRDTSFLEFCLKQSTSEAEILLRENLGLFDPDHEFIDKFLNYKELLSADVLEIAFQAGNDRKASAFGVRNWNTDAGGLNPNTGNESNKGGGKKKGKKGKKVVSPSVLGFNVVSNRIMMGEIQTVEE